nr:MMPL family transporter [Pseudobutyrivibrio sp.]
MEGLSRVVVKRRKLIVILALILTLLGAIGFFNVKINYNMTDYLPANANSTVALDIMEEEFNEAVPNCNVMMDDVSIVEALDIKSKLEGIDGISNVTWLDDVVDVKQPVEYLDQDRVDDYYVDGSALFSVTIDDGKEQAVTDAIKATLGDEAKLSGNAVEQADSQRLASSQTISAICVLGPLIILILIVATTSWIEPFIYLTAIGAAVMVNLGSDIFRGEISYVTLAVAPILQMAVSLDYAVFLSSAYEKNKKKAPNNGVAMVWAMCNASKSIFASALTTVFGFIALTLMDFKIGPDMGISLVKGVILSLISCMTFLPAAILLLNNLIEKTRHKKFMPDFTKIGKVATKIRIPTFIIVLAVAGFCFIAQACNSFTYGSGDAAGNTEEAVAIKEKFGESNVMVVLVPSGDITKEALLTSDIENMNHVTSVMSYAGEVGEGIPAEYLSNEIRENFYGDNYARIIVYSDLPAEGKDSFALVKNIRHTAKEYYGKNVYSCGQSANLYDMKNTVEADNKVVSVVTLLAIYIILAFSLKSWFLPLLLILTIKCSIWVNMSIPF